MSETTKKKKKSTGKVWLNIGKYRIKQTGNNYAVELVKSPAVGETPEVVDTKGHFGSLDGACAGLIKYVPVDKAVDLKDFVTTYRATRDAVYVTLKELCRKVDVPEAAPESEPGEPGGGLF